uniref:Uncharacterized protein n=1 Tax=viral metagenome TaxID=1070528 RepID=A0A6M3LPJ0_9ZZZZ
MKGYDNSEHPWKQEPMPIGRFAVDDSSDVERENAIAEEICESGGRYCFHTDMLFDDYANNAEEIMEARIWRK